MWVGRRWRIRGLGQQLFAELPFADELTWTEENLLEACRKLEAMQDQRKAEREQEKLDDAKPRPVRCFFCYETASPDRILVGQEGGRSICETCVAEAAAIIAKQKAEAA